MRGKKDEDGSRTHCEETIAGGVADFLQGRTDLLLETLIIGHLVDQPMRGDEDLLLT